MYLYESEKKNLFTERGQVTFLKIRDRAHKLLAEAGAFRQQEVTAGCSGDSFLLHACVDRLVELGEIVEIPRQCWGQYKVYSTPQVHNH